MAFINLSTLGFVLGLAALAGVLFALQRLRVRHREVPVETLLFWQAAIEPARARVLTERFRHPWAYALLLLIATALWVALAQPERRGEGERHLMLLDATARLENPERFDATVEELRRALADLPRDTREAWWCGSGLERLLAPGEDLELFDARLDGRRAERCGPSVDRAVEAHLSRVNEGESWSLWIAGDAPLSNLDRERLGEDVAVRRLLAEMPDLDGAGLTAMGWRARVEQPGRLDLWVAIEGSRQRAARPRMVRADGVQAPTPELDADSGDVARWWFRDALADGAEARVELRDGSGGTWSDDLPGDDRVDWRLPDLRELWIALEPGLPPSVREAVLADPGLVPVDQTGSGPDAAVAVVRFADSDYGGGLPALELTASTGDEPAFRLGVPRADDPVVVAEALVHQLALDQIDARALATVAGRSLDVRLDSGEGRNLGVWAELFGDAYDWTQQRSFPIFCGAALRWLGGAEAQGVSLADDRVGEAGTLALAWSRDGDGRTWQSLGAGDEPPAAGVWTAQLDGSDTTRFASLLDREVTAPEAVDAAPVDRAEVSAPGADAATWWIALALALLLLEWNLTRRGRMP